MQSCRTPTLGCTKHAALMYNRWGIPRSVVRRVGDRVGHNKLFKDKVFKPEDWAVHKSWLRFLPNPSISLRVLWGFAFPVAFHTIWAVCICLYHTWLVHKGAPDFWNKNTSLWQAFNLSSFCLSLLLVHRTTATYNRWWEARIVWGQILNATRNLMRTCASPMGFKQKDRPLLHMLARCAIAMSFLLRGHINRESAKPELEAVLLPGELNYVLVSNQPCLRIAQMASAIVGKAMPGPETQQVRVYIDEQIQLYVNCVGACERIYKTPVPFAFTRHLDRFLVTWLFFLPFAIWPIAGWATPFVEFVLAYLLMGTENIGIQIEEPFCIMPLAAFCAGNEESVVEIMDGLTGYHVLLSAVLQTARALTSSAVIPDILEDAQISGAEELVDAEIFKGECRGYRRRLSTQPLQSPTNASDDGYPTTPCTTRTHSHSFIGSFRNPASPRLDEVKIEGPVTAQH